MEILIGTAGGQKGNRRKFLRFCALLCVASLTFSASAQERTVSKEEVKAAFLFNFAKFAEWPAGTLSSNATIRIGVLGRNDGVVSALQKTVDGKKIDEHNVTVELYDELPGDPPHILFIAPAERRQVRRALSQLSGKPVLTVSEVDGFCESGGVINFQLEGRKMRFEINPKAAEKQRLKLSSKLLSIALRLVETESEP